jgi:hypothetical protein
VRLLLIPKRPIWAAGLRADQSEARLASAKLFSRERGGATSATLYREIVMEVETASKALRRGAAFGNMRKPAMRPGGFGQEPTYKWGKRCSTENP